jgi:4-amino-4-deoxy-L-arabinose transferase-like glycosyltransferase
VELRRLGDAGLARALIPVAALAAITLVRLAVANAVPLAPDEAYYWIWSRALAPGYLDHPPMIALWIRAGTTLAGETPLGVRLLGPLSVAVGSCLLADAAERLLPGRHAGLVAAALFNATLLAGVGSVIMTPDTPLLFFWTATMWALARFATVSSPTAAARAESASPLAEPRPALPFTSTHVIAGPRVQSLPRVPDRSGSGSGAPSLRTSPPMAGRWLLAAGVFAGLGLASKYTATLLWPGIALWLLWVPTLRPLLRRPLPWVAAILGLLLFLPVMVWNGDHDWAGLLRQGGRVTDWHAARAAQFLGELVGGQIGLATPLVFLLCAAGLASAVRLTWRHRDPGFSLLTALSLPPVLVFVQHAFGDRVQGNWPAIIYPAAVIAAAALATPRWVRLRGPSLGLGFAITGLVYLQAATGVLPIPPAVDPIARQLSGWNGLAEQIEAVRRQAGAGYVVADQYALASELAWTLPAGTRIVGFDPRWALTTLGPARLEGQIGLLVVPARSEVPPQWRDPESLETISRGVDHYALFRVKAGPAQASMVDLPRP